jgi:hypothetical protein
MAYTQNISPTMASESRPPYFWSNGSEFLVVKDSNPCKDRFQFRPVFELGRDEDHIAGVLASYDDTALLFRMMSLMSLR